MLLKGEFNRIIQIGDKVAISNNKEVIIFDWAMGHVLGTILAKDTGCLGVVNGENTKLAIANGNKVSLYDLDKLTLM
jgi:hypothetical protein